MKKKRIGLFFVFSIHADEGPQTLFTHGKGFQTLLFFNIPLSSPCISIIQIKIIILSLYNLEKDGSALSLQRIHTCWSSSLESYISWNKMYLLNFLSFLSFDCIILASILFPGLFLLVYNSCFFQP